MTGPVRLADTADQLTGSYLAAVAPAGGCRWPTAADDDPERMRLTAFSPADWVGSSERPVGAFRIGGAESQRRVGVTGRGDVV
jgi:hypothetical protein